MKKLITLTLALLLLSGCSLFKTKIITVTKVIKVPVNNIVYARPMRPSLSLIEWKVYGEKNAGNAAIYLKDKALMCLSTDHYENLGTNMKSIFATEEGLYDLLEKYEADRTTDEAEKATEEK